MDRETAEAVAPVVMDAIGRRNEIQREREVRADMRGMVAGEISSLVALALSEQDADNDYWEQEGMGQDSQEAEDSGFIAGMIAGLELARDVAAGVEKNPAARVIGLGDHDG